MTKLAPKELAEVTTMSNEIVHLLRASNLKLAEAAERAIKAAEDFVESDPTNPLVEVIQTDIRRLRSASLKMMWKTK